MRDYILTQSIARDSTYAFPKLRRMIRSWFLKRSLKALDQLEDHVLFDIGLARSELRHLCAMPLDVDLPAEMVRLRSARLPAVSEERGHRPVKRPEPAQPLAIGGGERRVGFDLGGDGRLGAAARGILAR